MIKVYIMKIKITTLKTLKYKGHTIRKVLTQFNCEEVLIDNDADEIENAPVLMKPQDFTYASIEDAKRFVRGEQMMFIPQEADILRDRYYNRFKS